MVLLMLAEVAEYDLLTSYILIENDADRVAGVLVRSAFQVFRQFEAAFGVIPDAMLLVIQ